MVCGLEKNKGMGEWYVLLSDHTMCTRESRGDRAQHLALFPHSPPAVASLVCSNHPGSDHLVHREHEQGGQWPES
jgi:hypothetical protein